VAKRFQVAQRGGSNRNKSIFVSSGSVYSPLSNIDRRYISVGRPIYTSGDSKSEKRDVSTSVETKEERRGVGQKRRGANVRGGW